MEKKYILKEEHKEMFGEWAEKWIKNAFSVGRATEEEKKEIKKQVKKLYEAAKLQPPLDSRIIIVPSPLVGRIASGLAAAIWYLRKNVVTNAATDDATYAATDDATDAAIDDATSEAVRNTIYAATCTATNNASNDATYAAVRIVSVAVRVATDDATRAAVEEATSDATDDVTSNIAEDITERDKKYVFYGKEKLLKYMKAIFGKNINFALQCCQKSRRFYQGGNMWCGWLACQTFFRYIAKIDIDFSKWNCYEKLGELSGFRFVHKEFCIVSEKPVILKTTKRENTYLPHCENGPYIQWADGFGIFALNGIIVPRWLVETSSENIPIEKYFVETNVEIRKEIYRKIGAERFLKASNSELIDEWIPQKNEIETLTGDRNTYELYLLDLGFEKFKYLKMALTDKQGLTSYYLECCINQETNSAKEAFYSDRPWLSEKSQIILT